MDKCRYLKVPFVANSTRNVVNVCRVSSTSVQYPANCQDDTHPLLY